MSGGGGGGSTSVEYRRVIDNKHSNPNPSMTSFSNDHTDERRRRRRFNVGRVLALINLPAACFSDERRKSLDVNICISGSLGPLEPVPRAEHIFLAATSSARF